MVVLFILLVFFRADKNAGDASSRSVVNIIAWGLGAMVSVTALLFARTSVLGRLGLGLLMIYLVGGWTRSLDYHYSVHVLGVCLTLAVTLVAAVGFIRPRSWTDSRYGRQVLIVRAICVLLLVSGAVITARLASKAVAHREAEFEYLFLGMQEQYNRSFQPTLALMVPLQHDDSLTTTDRVLRMRPLLERQLTLTEDLQARVSSVEAPDKYRKMQESYVQLLEATADFQKAVAESSPDADFEAMTLDHIENSILPAMRIYHAELRAAGFDVAENLAEESFEKALNQYY